jgi:hypothetical protein
MARKLDQGQLDLRFVAQLGAESQLQGLGVLELTRSRGVLFPRNDCKVRNSDEFPMNSGFITQKRLGELGSTPSTTLLDTVGRIGCRLVRQSCPTDIMCL